MNLMLARSTSIVARSFSRSGLPLLRFTQVRWLSSKLRAITAIKKNLHALVLHMESASTGKTDNSAKARGYLKEISSQQFIRALHIMLDILPILSNVSKSEDSSVSQRSDGWIMWSAIALSMLGFGFSAFSTRQLCDSGTSKTFKK